jgi:glycosyltransferase involved in cell wall biosynthesis
LCSADARAIESDGDWYITLPKPGSKRVRVLFVNTRSAIGADVAVHLTLIKNFDPEHVDVHVATNSRAVDVEKMLGICRSVNGVKVDSLNLGYELSGRGKAAKLLGAVGNIPGLLFGLMRLMLYVLTRKIDVIHTTDRPRDALVGTLLARLTGRKNVIHVHIKWYPEIGRATTWASQKCYALLAISQFVRRSMIEGGIPDHKIYTALNSTDVGDFNPANAKRGLVRQKLGLTDETPMIGIVARIMVWKGQLELVEALAELHKLRPGVHLAIVGKEDLLAGDDPASYSSKVRQRAEALGVQDYVHWAGWFDDMPAVMADLDVVCVPSWEEPFGLVVTEALSMERPVVGYNTGALPEIIRDGVDGLLVSPKDPQAMSQAIDRCLGDESLASKLGKSGRNRVIEQFTPRRQADEVASIYRLICANQPMPSN